MTAWCQPAAVTEFEVVSIKPTQVDGGGGSRFFGCRGGPGSSDPGLITCSHEAAGGLVPLAYGVGLRRVSYAKLAGGPGWPQFEIAAKVPRGATKEQVRVMWQNLLTERFHLELHREIQEVPAYELIVSKGGFKAKEWAERPADGEVAPWEPGTAPKLDKDGFPVLPPGRAVTWFHGNKAWFAAPAGTMQQLATMLEGRLTLNTGGTPRPVVDGTGLSGTYDLKFWWSPKADSDDSAEGPSMLGALESQLGLQVRARKSAPVEMLIVDHLNRTPTEN